MPRITARIAVAVGERLRQRLQDDDAAAFAAHIAVGALVEGEAAAAARQHRGAAEAEKRIGREQQVDAADDRGLDAAVADRLAGVVQRDQRRRTGGIDRQARPAQIEDVGDPVGEDARASRRSSNRYRRSPDRRGAGRGSRSTSRRYRRRSRCPRAWLAGMPASSAACHTSSSSIRCCGSICAASRGEMPKNAGSNRSTSAISPADHV